MVFDVVGDVRCDVIEGDVMCVMWLNGVVFELMLMWWVMMMFRGEENGAMAFIGEGDGMFMIEMWIVLDFIVMMFEE